MRGKNIFAIALSFSLAWHLVGAGAFHIVWPQKLAVHKFAEISFWGSFLESESLDLKDIDNEGKVKTTQSLSGTFESAHDDMEFNVLEKEIMPITELSEKKDPDIVMDTKKSEEFLISESIKSDFKRSILVKPKLPAYPEWAKELGSYFEMELKFLILPDGTVGTVEKVTSAGYPELDEIGIRYVRQWKFMPLPEGAKGPEQWGVVKLVFNLK